MNDVEEKIYNIHILVKELKNCPHTYETILGEKCTNNTCTTILKRKLSNLCKMGIVNKISVPGTRFGKSLFIGNPKKYYIIVESTRLGSLIYYFNKYKKVNVFRIKIDNYYQLNNSNWIKKEKKIIDNDSVLLFI